MARPSSYPEVAPSNREAATGFGVYIAGYPGAMLTLPILAFSVFGYGLIGILVIIVLVLLIIRLL